MAEIRFYSINGRALSLDSYTDLAPHLTEAERYRLPKKSAQGAWRRHILSRLLMRRCVIDAFGDVKQVTYHADSAPQIECDSVNLSLSHCGAVAAVAIGYDCRVGCDVLTIGRSKNWRQLYRRWFHESDIKWLSDAPEAEQEHRFTELWCRKEAFAKAFDKSILECLGMDIMKAAPWAYSQILSEFGCAVVSDKAARIRVISVKPECLLGP